MQAERVLGRSRSCVARLVELGKLRPVGRRGLAHVYRAADVRRLAVELNGRNDDVVLLQDYLTQAADLEDRRHALAVELVADDAWRPAWRRFVAALHARTRELIERAAALVGALTPDDPRARAIDSSYDPPPPRSQRTLRVGEALALLAGPRPGWPAGWETRDPECIRRALRTHDPADVIAVDAENGAWCAARAFVPDPPPVLALDLIRPWLQATAEWAGNAPSWLAVAAALEPPPPGPPPSRPASVADARSAWRAARSAWRSARVAARRGHRRRADMRAAIDDALRAWRSAWWGWRGELPGLAGDPAAIRREGRALAERARVALLQVAS